MKVTVKFFVPLNQEVGINQTEVELPEGATGTQLLDHLAEQFAHIQPARERFRRRRVYFLVGKEFIGPDVPLQDQQIIVLIPSGSCCHP